MILYSQTTAADDETTMTTTRNLVKTKVPAEKFIKEWKEHHDNMVRNKNRLRHRDYIEKRWGEHLLPLSREPRAPDTSSITSYNSDIMDTSSTCTKQQTNTYKPNTLEITQRPYITRYGADIPKKVLDNIPAFECKQGELSQFLNTIESYSMMYRICTTDLVLLCSRGKAHEIISPTIAEDADTEWSDIKRKLTSNYGSTRSGIEASVKISKLSMTSKETVGEYLARARTLVKLKIKNIAMWNSTFDKADAYHVCNRLLKTELKTWMLRRVSQFKNYKDFFNNIEDEWEQSYFMEDDFAGKDDTTTTTAEVDEIYTWNETSSDDPTEAEMMAEVNQVYHKYGQYPPSPYNVVTGHRDPDFRDSNSHSGEAEEARDHLTTDTRPPDTKT